MLCLSAQELLRTGTTIVDLAHPAHPSGCAAVDRGFEICWACRACRAQRSVDALLQGPKFYHLGPNEICRAQDVQPSKPSKPSNPRASTSLTHWALQISLGPATQNLGPCNNASTGLWALQALQAQQISTPRLARVSPTNPSRAVDALSVRT